MYGQNKYRRNSTRSTHALVVSYIALFIAVIALVSRCKGQGSWNIVNLKYNINPKFSLFSEGQVRSLKFYDHFHYHEISLGANYKADPGVVLTLAAGHYDTYKEGGNFVLPKNSDEFRVWPQVTLLHASGRLKFEHRYRAEFRFAKNGTYHNRYRYRITASYPFGKEKNGYRPFQISATDEIFFNDITPFFQRNRFWAYFNYKVSKQVYFQAGYVYQIDYKINDETGRDFFQIGVYIELSKQHKQSNQN